MAKTVTLSCTDAKTVMQSGFRVKAVVGSCFKKKLLCFYAKTVMLSHSRPKSAVVCGRGSYQHWSTTVS